MTLEHFFWSVIPSGVFIAGLLWHQRTEFARQDRDRMEAIRRDHEHEQQAKYREERALERHDRQLTEMLSQGRIMSGIARSQHDIHGRVEWLEEAVDNHGEHLEQMGRPDVHRLPAKNGRR
jgi:hypothetical protein